MRAGEKEGVDYYFWDELPFNRDVVSLKEYYTARGTWYYWFNADDIEKAAKSADNYIVIADVDGAKILEEYGAKIIYIYATLVVRMKRYYNRVSRDKNPDYKEVLRRVIADLEAFNDFETEFMSHNERYCVSNSNYTSLDSAVNEVNDIIRGYEKWC